jgi:hypothetical protein
MLPPLDQTPAFGVVIPQQGAEKLIDEPFDSPFDKLRVRSG